MFAPWLIVLPEQSSICGWRVTASLVLEGVVDFLKRLFAVSLAQEISSGKEDVSIVLEFDRDVVELLITLSFINEIVHFGDQGFENFWLLILLDRITNPLLQVRPVFSGFLSEYRIVYFH